MTARSFISSHRNCRRFLTATHHAKILNNSFHDLQVLHFTMERGLYKMALPIDSSRNRESEGIRFTPNIDLRLLASVELSFKQPNSSSFSSCGIGRREQRSGTTLEGRPESKTILDFIHPGETLVVTRIDRLAHSMQDLQVIVARLKERGAHLAATEQPVDTSTAAGKAFFDMLGVFAEFETNPRRKRQAERINLNSAVGV